MHSERQVLNIVECRYNAVWYHMILKTALQRLKQNINQSLPPHKTLHTSPLRASYGVSIVRIFEKNRPRYNDTALYKKSCALALTLFTEEIGSIQICQIFCVAVPLIRRLRRTKAWFIVIFDVFWHCCANAPSDQIEIGLWSLSSFCNGFYPLKKSWMISFINNI